MMLSSQQERIFKKTKDSFPSQKMLERAEIKPATTRLKVRSSNPPKDYYYRVSANAVPDSFQRVDYLNKPFLNLNLLSNPFSPALRIMTIIRKNLSAIVS